MSVRENNNKNRNIDR